MINDIKTMFIVDIFLFYLTENTQGMYITSVIINLYGLMAALQKSIS